MESDPITGRLYLFFKYDNGVAFTTTTKERAVTIGSTLRNLIPLIMGKSRRQIIVSTELLGTAIVVEYAVKC
jgi:hypothetical protein